MKIRLLLPVLVASMMPLMAQANDMPNRIIVPFSAGGATDTVARGLAARLGELWGQPIVVENRPGAAGTIGSRQVATAGPNDRVLLIVASGHATNVLVHKSLPYDTLEDFTPVAQLVDVPNVFLVPKSSPIQDIQSLVAVMKESPDRISYGTSGVGTSVHLAGELFKAMSGANMEVVYFKGDSESLTNVVGAHVPLSINTVPGAKAQIDAGNVRALGVTSAQRVPIVKEIPTIQEQGIEGYEVTTWFGMLGPKGMDSDLVKRINADIKTAMTNTDLSNQLSERGMIINVGTPADFDTLIRTEIDKWRPIVQGLDLRSNN